MSEKANPNLSTYMNFASAVREQGFTRDAISRNFNRLVSKDDYERKDKQSLIDGLTRLSELGRVYKK